MSNYLNPETVPLVKEMAFTNPAATVGTTIYCWKAPAAGNVTEVNLLKTTAGVAATTNIAVKIMNGSSTIVSHGTATAWTANSFTTETITTGAFSDGDTVHIIVIGDGTVDCTLTAQMTVVFGYPGAQG
jgi:hypothetical protein